MKAPDKLASHISDFYIEQFSAQCGLELEARAVRCDEVMIRATDADVSTGGELLEEHGVDPSRELVVIHPGSGGRSKCWHLDNFLAVARELRDKQVLFLLGPAELERFSDSAIKAIEAEAKCMRDLSLVQVLAVLSCARGFVGNDSGITHLAAALGVRTVAVFGPTDRDVYRPIGPAVTTVLCGRSERFAESVSVQMQQRLLDALEA
jgi:ADP-heptose:LPS heptosyltransferase